VTPDGALLLSADRESDAISLIDTKTMQRIGQVKVGTHPFGLAIEPDGAGLRRQRRQQRRVDRRSRHA
jgi:YVTN family beta-propeller protein